MVSKGDMTLLFLLKNALPVEMEAINQKQSHLLDSTGFDKEIDGNLLKRYIRDEIMGISGLSILCKKIFS